MKPKENRVYILDALRGFAVVAMIFHHGYVLLNFMYGIEHTFFSSTAFFILQEFFAGLFIVISGICTNYSRNTLKRGIEITAFALVVTLITAVILPAFGITDLEIYFGILHMFGLSMILYALLKPLLDKINKAVLLGVCVILYAAWLYFMQRIPYVEGYGNLFMIFGFPDAEFYSADYYPLFPYFLLFVAGGVIGKWIKAKKFPDWFYTFRAKLLEFIGRHALIIYIAHQPVFFALFWAAGEIYKKFA